MLAGGDSVDDTAVLRAGGRVAVRRHPGTVDGELLARLWAAGAGPPDRGASLTIDVDSPIVAVHGWAKQGAAFGYTKVRGYHP